MATRDGELAAVFGTMGGDAQPQILLQVAARLFVHGGSARRRRRRAALGAARPVARASTRGPAAARRRSPSRATRRRRGATGLAARGHRVDVAAPFDSGFGHAHAIIVEADGAFAAAADPRARIGSAAGRLTVPEGHTLHRLARSQRAQFAGRVDRRVQPAGPVRRRRPGRRSRARRRDALTASTCSPRSATASCTSTSGCSARYDAGDGRAAAAAWRGAHALGRRRPAGPTCAGRRRARCSAPSEVDAILARLGPDPLRARPDGSRAFARIARSRAPIAGLLMDQAVLAGVGNVYRAEILYRHRIDPYLPGRLLDASRWQPLWADLVTLMRAGLRAGRIVTTVPADRSRRPAGPAATTPTTSTAAPACRAASAPPRSRCSSSPPASSTGARSASPAEQLLKRFRYHGWHRSRRPSGVSRRAGRPPR